ncbi:MAG: DUF805 domain-containing protein [Planctomycetaceae bacterium]|jgi:uncharacterized membrane protein YhaH (DUF805 family)|nr:DUF805 domain-containing protein [Planctomycetaceae bacterium]
MAWYYYDDDGEKQGPISPAQLKALAANGMITPETMLESEDGRTGKAGKLNGLSFPEPPSDDKQEDFAEFDELLQLNVPHTVPVPPPFGTSTGDDFAASAVNFNTAHTVHPQQHVPKFCQNCGNKLSASAAFCPQCGSATSAANTTPQNYQSAAQGIGNFHVVKNNFFDVLKKYCVFRGRARREEFWMFELVYFIILFVLFLPLLFALLIIAIPRGGSIEATLKYGDDFATKLVLLVIGAIPVMFWVVTLLPVCGVAVRRLHDTGRSGLCYWIYLVLSLFVNVHWIFYVPLAVVSVVLLFFLVLDSEPQTNQYGPNPKWK